MDDINGNSTAQLDLTGDFDSYVDLWNTFTGNEEDSQTVPKDYEKYDPTIEGFTANDDDSTQCNTHDYPDYDPNHYDEYCQEFYWCFKEYDPITCSPVSATGWTEYEAMQVISASYWGPAYILWLAAGLWLMPWSTCLFMSHYNYTYCDAMGDWFLELEWTVTNADGTTYEYSMMDILNDTIGDWDLSTWLDLSTE
jgi:hypothetical protein